MTHSFSIVLAIAALFLCNACTVPPTIYQPYASAHRVDYSRLEQWASHPEKQDFGNLVPRESVKLTSSADVDVFFVHPTTYTGKAIKKSWTAPVDDQGINAATDKSTIKFQASIFNQIGRLYAPRYRQAHINAFYTDDRVAAKKALDFAYFDVLAAFDHYLRYENQGRPFIIAAHSQGTVHAARLIKERIDGNALRDQLVIAYLVGMPIKVNEFQHIMPCRDSSDLHCFVSWRTFKKSYIPDDVPLGDSIAVHNPLNWKLNGDFSPRETSKGAVLRNFDKVLPKAIEAETHKGILWTNKPKFPMSFLFTRKNYHIVDFNFFYEDVKLNAQQRVKKFLNKERQG